MNFDANIDLWLTNLLFWSQNIFLEIFALQNIAPCIHKGFGGNGIYALNWLDYVRILA